MANRRPFLELFEKWAIILGGIAATLTLFFAAMAYFEYKAANRVAARGQLYSTSDQIAERERNDPDYGLLSMDASANTPIDGYYKKGNRSVRLIFRRRSADNKRHERREQNRIKMSQLREA